MSESEITVSGFNTLGLSPAVLAAVEAVGYEVPTPIQAQTIPPLLEGKDLLGQAQTGTGKTAAFALPLLSRIDVESGATQILVLAPTRELSIQVAEAFQRYAAKLENFHVAPIYGGQDMHTQLRKLKRGVQVVVGTPGRVMDHIRRGTLKLSNLSALVLDEGDEMLNMGFIEDIEWILEKVPETTQVALFSATLPPQIRKIAKTHLVDPVEIMITQQGESVLTIRQRCWFVTGTNKTSALTRILEAEDFDGVLIFVRTKTQTVELSTKLEAHGFSCAPLNGDITQAKREETVARLKSGRIDIIVATDVAARGLDINRISHVINYDIPTDRDSYIHRIGRTGRMGKQGDAILFVSPRERGLFRALNKATGQKIEMMELPTQSMVRDIRIERFKARITEALGSDKIASYREIIEEYLTESGALALDAAAALALIVNEEKPLLETKKSDDPPKKDTRDFSEKKRFDRKARSAHRDERRDFSDKKHGDRKERFDHKPKREEFHRDRDHAEPNRFARRKPFRDKETDGAPHRTGENRPPRFSEKKPFKKRESGFDKFDRAPQRTGDDRPKHFSEKKKFKKRESEFEHTFERAPRRSEEDRPPRKFRDEMTERGAHRKGRGKEKDAGKIRMTRYKVSAGNRDGVSAGDIADVIVRESGLERKYIGRIDIQEDSSFIELPSGMPRQIFRALKNENIGGRKMNLAPVAPFYANRKGKTR